MQFVPLFQLQLIVLIAGTCLSLFAVPPAAVSADECNAYYTAVLEQYPAMFAEKEHFEREWFDKSLYLNSLEFHPPGQSDVLPIAVAMRANLENDESLEREAAKLLLRLVDYTEFHPDSIKQNVPEYRGSTPLLHNFFSFFTVSRAYLYVRDSPQFSAVERRRMDSSIAVTADYMCRFPEWGAMNRAIIRGLGLLYAAEALKDHPNTEQWRSVAHSLYADSFGAWQIEDAQLYQTLWMYCMILFAEQIGDESLAQNVQFRYYFDYYLNLISPSGMIPAFGDSRFEESRLYLAPAFEWAARTYNRPDYAWLARQVQRRSLEHHNPRMHGFTAMTLLDAWRWCANDIAPQRPWLNSGPVLDDVIAKKIVFRSGSNTGDTYMLLNYREQANYGGLAREFIEQTIPVESEKTHHGHDDINAIVNLTVGGQLLLSSAGYRNGVPSGPYGGFRADYFQNRLVVRNRRRWPDQGLYEFLRDAGPFQPVRSRMIDFTSLDLVDVSRTRLEDAQRGYRSDRAICWLREHNLFVVVDIVEVLRSGHYSFANLWHGTTIHQRGENYFVSSVDSVAQHSTLESDTALLIYFPENTLKTDSLFKLHRNGVDSYCMYQSCEGHYLTGSFETFVTILKPQKRTESPQVTIDKIQLIDVDNQEGLAITYGSFNRRDLIAFKSDLAAELHPQNIRPRYSFERGRVAYQDLETDAIFAHVRQGASSTVASATHLTQLNYGDTVLFQSTLGTFSKQPTDNSTGYGRPKWRRWNSDLATHRYHWPRSGAITSPPSDKSAPR